MPVKMFLLFVLFSPAAFQAAAQTTAASPALLEAQKLSTEVVKLFQQQKYEEALPLAQKAISIREKELGKYHISVAHAWRNLAYIQHQREKLKDAGKAFENAFEIYEKNQPLSPENEKTFAELLEAVAVFEAINSDATGAEKKFLRAVELREKISGKESAETANSLVKLSQIYQIKGDYDKAAPLLLRALDIKTRKTGKIDDESKEAYDNATCTLSKLNREDEKNQLRERFYPSAPQKADSPGKEQVKTVSGGVVNGKALYLHKPHYPYEAREKRISGSVTVQVLIDESGKVIFACAVSGARELQRAAEVAAYQSKFSPTTLVGKPVKVSGIVTYKFEL
jgi:TonB family protein